MRHQGALIIAVAVVTLMTAVTWPLVPFVHPRTNSAPIVPNGPLGGWRLAFDDEFSGRALDSTKWTTCSPQLQQDPCRGWGSELEVYTPGNVSVHGGQLHLAARRSGSGFTSGMVNTGPASGAAQPGYRGFAFLYGYYEAFVRVPAGQGLWPAVWAFGADLVPPFELDDVEILGSDPRVAFMTALFPGGAHRDQRRVWGPDFSAGFHSFGVDWEPDHISWYIDGRLARDAITNRSEIPDKPMYLILDLAVGGDWPGAPSASTPFPASMDVDYVRVFQSRSFRAWGSSDTQDAGVGVAGPRGRPA